MPTRASVHKSSKRAIAKVLATARSGEFFLTTALGDENTLLVAPPGKKVKALLSAMEPDIKNAKKMSCGIVRMSGKKVVFQIGPVKGARPAVKAVGEVRKVLKALKSEPGLSFLGKVEVTQDEVDEVTITDKETGSQLIGDGEVVSEGEELSQEEMISLLVDDDLSLSDAQKLIGELYSLSKGLDEIDMMALDTFKPGDLLKMESSQIQEKDRHEREVEEGRELLSKTKLTSESEVFDALDSYKKLRAFDEGRQVLEDLGISESQLKFLKNNMPSDLKSLPRLTRRLLRNFGTEKFDVEVENAGQKKGMMRLLKGTSRPEMVKGDFGMEHRYTGGELKGVPHSNITQLIVTSRYRKEPMPEEARQFEVHLISEFSHENIAFLDACHKLLTSEEEITRQDYRDLVARFIETGSEKEINIAHGERLAILQALSQKKPLEEIASCLAMGVGSIRLLLKDSQSRFVKKSKKDRKKMIYDRAVLEERWYKGREIWLALPTTTPMDEQVRIKRGLKPYSPDDESSFVPTMSRGEANAVIVTQNIESMG